VIEVHTPVLGHSTATDPHIQSFSVYAPAASPSQPPDKFSGYLQTSPELFMKRLLAAGSGDIYQIAKVFRAGEAGRLHAPEFTMLEWYRLDIDHHQLMDEVARLVEVLLGDKAQPQHRLTYKMLFEQHFGFNPHTCNKKDLLACAEAKGLERSTIQALTTSDLLDMLFSFFIQPNLAELTFVYDYPVIQAMLSRLGKSADTKGLQVACRFELFFAGVELANGFYELADACEQRHRFERDNKERLRLGLPIIPLDEAFLTCLDNGFPYKCAGVSIGLDRLFMTMLGEDEIAK